MAEAILRKFNGFTITQSANEGGFNATEMCQAHGKLFANWRHTGPTEEYLSALSLNIGIAIDKLVQSTQGRYGGTWVHPLIAIRLAQWLSPEFAVQVDLWVDEVRQGRKPDITDLQSAVRQHLGEQVCRIDHHQNKIVQLDAYRQDHETRIKELEKRPRNGPSPKQKSRLAKVLDCFYGGMDPVSGEVKLTNGKGQLLPYVEVDHWNENREDNAIHNLWPLSRKSHVLKRTTDLSTEFQGFQNKRVRMEENEKQKELPLAGGGMRRDTE